MADIRVEGMAEFGRKLRQLPIVVRDKVATRAVYEGAKVVRKSLEDRSPVDTGKLQKSMRVARRKKGVKSGEVMYVVFVRGVQSSSGKRSRKQSVRKRGTNESPWSSVEIFPYYWYFLEYGTSKMRQHVGWMRSTFVSAALEALERGRDYGAAAFKREAKKLGLKVMP